MDKNINVLFLGGSKRVSLAEQLIGSAKSRGINIFIFSYELSENVPISLVATVIVGLKWSDNRILNHLMEIINLYDIQFVLPFVDPAIDIASKLKKIFPYIYVPCCSTELCQIMLNKKLSAKWFNEKSISIPETFTVEYIKYPAILKPIIGSASKGIKIIYNQSELYSIVNIDEYLIQYYISNNIEYTVDCFVSKAHEVISIVPRIRLETAGGEVVNTLTRKDELIIELSKKILQSDCFVGPITIQFLKDLSDDKVYVMEINPRLGGGVIASIAAGVDIMGLLIDEYLGMSLSVICDWRDSTLMMRYFKEVIFYANNN